TVAIAALKWGHLLYPGAALCGEITTVDIGIDAQCSKGKLLEKDMLAQLPPRPARAHKGTFGRVLTIGGSVGMSGAAYFAAKAALRAGCGLSEIFTPADNRIIYQTQLPEALLTLYDPNNLDTSLLLAALSRADAVALGMGLSQSETAKEIVALVLKHAEVPLIVDADALNLIAEDPKLHRLCIDRCAPTVLTPHLGEMSRLCRVDIPSLAAHMVQHAKVLATQSKAILVMKDARTLITDGDIVYLNPYGNSGMATGGSGDVLAGVIAALAAQGASPIDAARLGVLAHALAGDAAHEQYGNHGLMASDIIDGLCRVLP
ncbi:MAG: NAD(P)H-hydrate dehydratase, partial [Clostridia bacterium]|nr:NAD(P)H-hydrate dehydratase [Clostridia bacterium]